MDIGWAGGGGRLELSSGLLGFHFGLRRCWSRWRQHVRHAARNHIDDVPLVLLGPAHCDVIDVIDEVRDGGPDSDVTVAVAHHLEIGHLVLGRRLLGARLVGTFGGARVQRRRIETAIVVLGAANVPRRGILRHAWYEEVGPWFCLHMDQNEHIGFTGLKILCAVDGYTRCPGHWKVVTSLRGLEHARFLQELVFKFKRVPAHVSIDGTKAWGGAKLAMGLFWGDEDEDDGADIVHLAEGPVKVKRTMVVNSVLNSIVERQWFECNDVTENIKQEARTLIRQDLMQAGRNPDRIDQYCFCAAYRADVTHRVDVHYRAMQLRRKEVTTRNPNYPRGTYVPLHRLNEAGDGCSLRVTDEEIAVVDRFVADYYGSTAALAIEPQSPWEVDPLDPAERAACDTLVASMGSMTPMETYVVMRGETHRLVDARL